MLVAASAAGKVLLLSGTPIVNVEEDVKNLLYAIQGKVFDYESYKLFKSSMHQVWPHTDFHRVEMSDPRLPECSIRREVFTMPPPFLAWYNSVEDDVREAMGSSQNLKMFMNGVRRAVNGCSWSSSNILRRSPKIEWLREHMATCMDDGEKVMIYSAWKSFGVKNVSDALRDRRPDIAIGAIDGEMSTTARASTVTDFNEGRLHVLIVTAAGAEGIDLKGTRHVVILEPHWNPSRTDQAIGRACRINSHADLPPEKRNVTVHNLILQKPEACKYDTQRPYESADVLLEMKSLEKKQLYRAFMSPYK
jgi:superfamily II DNA or RNA helicase